MVGPGSDVTEQHFTGKERDIESGLDDFGARYYSSSFGRFMTPDWNAHATPVPYAKLDDPQTLNLYAFVHNNPLNQVDLDGHGGCTDYPQICKAILDNLSKGQESGEAILSAQQQSPSDAKTAKINSRAQSQYIMTFQSSRNSLGFQQTKFEIAFILITTLMVERLWLAAM